MTKRLLLLRWKKLFFCATHPWCWQPLRHGVAPSMDQAVILRGLDFDLLLDAGANKGQFTLISRHVKPQVPVQAFEPHPGEAETFRKVHGKCRTVTLHQVALGEREETLPLLVCNRADSSSFLTPSDVLPKIISGTEPSGVTVSVPVVPLDVMPAAWRDAARALLKIDVQGFELNVLKGAAEALGHCGYVYVECSEVPLYEGQALREDVARFLRGHGFRQVGRYHEDKYQGVLVQADYLFAR
jgi:FkbM family methyltransferase